MSDYKRVGEALKAGADPIHLCMTCPWDRFCLLPPTMTSEDVDAEIEKAKAKDDERDLAKGGGHEGIPMTMLLTSLHFSGKDQSAEICPVFALRLRSGTGREISDSLKSRMKEILE